MHKEIKKVMNKVKSTPRSHKLAYIWCQFMFFELKSLGNDARDILSKYYDGMLSDYDQMKLVHSLGDLLREIDTFDKIKENLLNPYTSYN